MSTSTTATTVLPSSSPQGSRRDIRRVAVLGAGTMGSRIAAHIANAGLPVVLLDIVPPGTPSDAPRAERNKIVLAAVEASRSPSPPPSTPPNPLAFSPSATSTTT